MVIATGIVAAETQIEADHRGIMQETTLLHQDSHQVGPMPPDPPFRLGLFHFFPKSLAYVGSS